MTLKSVGTAVVLIALAASFISCAPQSISTDSTDINSAYRQTSTLIYHKNGEATDLSGSVYAARIGAASIELLQSCQSRLKQSVSAMDWQLARQAPFCLEIRTLKRSTVSMNNGSRIDVNALLLTLDADSANEEKVLTQHDNHYRSPFIMCNPELVQSLRTLVATASSLVQD